MIEKIMSKIMSLDTYLEISVTLACMVYVSERVFLFFFGGGREAYHRIIGKRLNARKKIKRLEAKKKKTEEEVDLKWR